MNIMHKWEISAIYEWEISAMHEWVMNAIHKCNVSNAVYDCGI